MMSDGGGHASKRPTLMAVDPEGRISLGVRWRWGAVAALGIGLGLCAAASDAALGVAPAPAVRVVNIATNAGAIWIGAAVLAGWLLRTRLWAILAAMGTLQLAVLSYYGYGLALGDRVGVGLAGVSVDLRLWLVSATIAGLPLGLIGRLARNNTPIGLAARMFAPVAVVAEVLLRFRPSLGGFRVDPIREWTISVLAGASAVAVLVLILAEDRRRKGRLAARTP